MSESWVQLVTVLSVVSTSVPTFDDARFTTSSHDLSMSHQVAQVSTPSLPSRVRSQVSRAAAESSSTETSTVTRVTKEIAARTAAMTSTLSSLSYESNDVVSVRTVTFDIDLIHHVWRTLYEDGSPPVINFFDQDVEAVSILHSLAEDGEDTQAILFETVDRSGWIVLSVNQEGNAVLGNAFLNGNSYDIAPIPGSDAADGKKPHVLVELNLAGKSELASQDTRRPDASDTLRHAVGATGYDCLGQKTVDVNGDLSILVGYTQEMQRKAANPDYGGPMAAKPIVENMQLNLARALSLAGVNVATNMPDPVEVAYVETRHVDGAIKTLDEALETLINGSNPEMVDFRNRRKNGKFDIAVLLIDLPDRDNCGKAQLSATPETAYAVVNWKCIGKLSFLHELGHVLGLYHKGDSTVTPQYAKPFLHIDQENGRSFMTLMGAASDCIGAPSCPRILRFSNPLETYSQSQGSSQAAIGVAGRADNACVLRQTVPRVALYGDLL